MKSRFLVRIGSGGSVFSDVKLSGKFYDDEVLIDDENYFILVNGVVLNSEQLSGSGSFSDYVLRNFTSGGGGIEDWRGNFCGIFYDKHKHCGKVFTDHFSSEPLVYYKDGKNLIISSSVKILVNYLRSQRINVSVSMAGAYSMLVYGFMYDNYTPFEGIYKLVAGTSINLTPNGGISEPEYYHKLCEPEHERTDLDAVVQEMGELFLKAAALAVEKNRHYGCTNYAPLSAGLDSRMTCFTLHKLGVEDAVLFTYSQIGEKDHVVPGKIAAYLGYTWLFKSLDNGNHLLDIDEAIDLADSLIKNDWPLELNGFLKLIDREKIGVVHTGVLGDVIVGSYYHRFTPKPYTLGAGASFIEAADWLKQKLKVCVNERHFKDYEAGMMNIRGMNGIVPGYATSFMTCGEGVSPFMYVEFFDLCMSVPFKFRTAHNLYYKWVYSFMPEAAKFRYNGFKIHDSRKYFALKNRYLSIDRICDILSRKIKRRLGLELGMTPSTKWYNENERLRNFMDSYFKEAVEFVEEPELREDLVRLYASDNAGIKIQCITLAGAVKNFLC